ncbi:hypothetical protein BV20DRAFT_1056948 [Pilatotrama ljubarskyi]|nr:hypothetical protein BV20DRAFT_1056948 [Pilatotrama ljubarskyi]
MRLSSSPHLEFARWTASGFPTAIIAPSYVGPNPRRPAMLGSEFFINFPATLEPMFYEVLFHLDVEHVIRMRRVCKFFYYVTHERALWAYLLRCADPEELPPRAPVSEIGPLHHGVPACLSALDTERILVRAASVRKNWAQRHPRPFRTWVHETFENVLDLCLLPGSEHLVTVQQDVKTRASYITLYKLDCHHDAEAMGAVPLAGRVVPGTLHANYMTVGGIPGLSVVCIQKFYEVVEHPDGTSEKVFMYSCRAVHICYDTMEKLAAAYVPGSLRYEELSASLPLSVTMITMPPPSVTPLSAPALGMLFDQPHVVFAREVGSASNELWFQCMEGGEPVALPVEPPEKIGPGKYIDWRIQSLRILTRCHSVIAASQYITSAVPGVYAPYPIAYRLDMFPALVRRPPWTMPIAEDPGVSWHHISPSGQDVRMSDLGVPPPAHNSLYAAAGLQEDRAPPMHVFIHSPMEFMERDAPLTGPNPDADQPPAQVLTNLEASLQRSIGLSNEYPAAAYRILPGARRALLYKVASSGSCDDHLRRSTEMDDVGKILSIHTVRSGVHPEHSDIEVHGVVERIPWSDGDAAVGAIAWDDTIGRLVVANPERTSFKVFDFAKCAQLDARGNRWPIPLQRRLIEDASLIRSTSVMSQVDHTSKYK